ncbi:MAG: NusG domain II-containing protein [Clostridia bacterium]|nr:NusG domain II-containing protein [Clostridia bacterium]
MKKGDWICILVFLAVCLAGLLLFLPRQGAETAVVTVDGETIMTLPLDRDGIYHTEHHTLEVQNGAVRVLASDCPGQDCVRTGPVSRGGQTIVCLPYRMSITLQTQGDYDAVTGRVQAEDSCHD